MDFEEFFRFSDPTFDIKDNILVGKKYDDEVETGNISELVLDSLKNSPEFLGHLDLQTGHETTFAEILDRSVRCALWLRSRGIGPGDIVTVSTPNRTDDYVPYLATYYVGGIYSPWYNDLTPSAAQHFFNLHRPKVMFTSPENISSLFAAAKLVPDLSCEFVCYDSHPDFLSLNQILSESTVEMVSSFQPTKIENPKTQIAAIMLSSGTTGIQKGASLSYETMVNNRTKYVLQRGERRVLWYSNLSWITGTNLITSCIRFKCTRFIHSAFDPDATCEIIQNHKIDWVLLTPSMLTRLCKAKTFERYNLTYLECLVITGSRLIARVIEEAQAALPHALISNSYGMTELGSWTTFQTKNRKKCDSIGHIVETVQMKVIDPKTSKMLGPNEQGELCFKLKNYMLGYFRNQGQIEEMIDNEGWLHTGDGGYYTTSGEIVLTDRLKQLIITSGCHISPPEIEASLLHHPAVLDAAVIGVPHEVDIERPLAFVKLRPGVQVTAEELAELPCAELGADSRLSGGVVFVEEIPYTGSGKKYIKKLREMAQAHARTGRLAEKSVEVESL